MTIQTKCFNALTLWCCFISFKKNKSKSLKMRQEMLISGHVIAHMLKLVWTCKRWWNLEIFIWYWYKRWCNMNLSISIYLNLSQSISIYLYISLSISIYLSLTVYLSISVYLSLSISIIIVLIHTSCRTESSKVSLVILDKLCWVLSFFHQNLSLEMLVASRNCWGLWDTWYNITTLALSNIQNC